MKNSIKINRALKIVKMLPTQRQHILSNIPDSVKDALTGSQLADLMEAMDKHFYEGTSHSETEINDFIGLPAGLSVWNVLADEYVVPSSNKSGQGSYVKFSDNLCIPDILDSRAQELKK